MLRNGHSLHYRGGTCAYVDGREVRLYKEHDSVLEAADELAGRGSFPRGLLNSWSGCVSVVALDAVAPKRWQTPLLMTFKTLFERDCEKVGVKRARLRYWAAALHSSWPFIRGAVGRLIAGAGILKAGAGIWKWWSGG
jgi:hypothetical protein